MNKLDNFIDSLPDDKESPTLGGFVDGLPDSPSSTLKARSDLYKDDNYSNVVNLAEKTGLPTKVVENNQKEAEHRANQPDWDKFEKESPKMADLMSNDLDFFRMAKDKTESLRKLEQTFNKTGLAAAAGKSLIRGSLMTYDMLVAQNVKRGGIQMVAGPAKTTTEEIYEQFLGPTFDPKVIYGPGGIAAPAPKITTERKKALYADAEKLAKERTLKDRQDWDEYLANESPTKKKVREATGMWLFKAGHKHSQSVNAINEKWQPDDYYMAKTFAENLSDEPIKAVLTSVLEQVPNLGVTMTVMLATRGKGATMAMGAGFGTGFLLEGGDIFSEGADFLEKEYGGIDKVPMEEWAKLTQLTNKRAISNAALDIALPAKLTQQARKLAVKSFLSKAGAKHIGRETVEALMLELPPEMVQEMAPILTAMDLGKQYTPEEIGNTLLQTTFGAGPIGGGSGAINAAIEVAGNVKANQAAKALDSISSQGKLDELLETAQEIDDKNVLKQSIDQLTDPDTENVYISAEKATEIFQSLDLPEDSNTVKAVVEQLQEATELNGDVLIPVKDFLNDVKDADLDLVRPHIRLSPDTLSQEELASDEGLKRADALIEEAKQHSQIKSEADLIYKQVRQELIDTGRLSASESGYTAKILPAYATIMAARKDSPWNTAKEVYEALGLKIEGPERRKDFSRPVAEPVEGDRRSDPGMGERRNPDLRAEFESLSEEEKFKIAYEDPLTGLRTKRAWDQLPPKKYRIALDLDGLGWVNDNRGHAAGNTVLQEVSKVLQEYLGTEDAFRTGGDEFAGQSDDLTDAQTKAQSIQDHLKNVTVEVQNPGEEAFTITGIGVSFGIGENDAIADQKLYEDKTRREGTGERAKKGNRPPGIEPGPSDTTRTDQAGGVDQDTGLDVLNQEALETQSAIEKGLPMDKESRLARAREMGFDTDTVYYHSTEYDFSEFRVVGGQNSASVGAHFGSSESANERMVRVRKNYTWAEGEKILPVYLSIKNPIKLKDMGQWSVDEILPQIKDKKLKKQLEGVAEKSLKRYNSLWEKYSTLKDKYSVLREVRGENKKEYEEKIIESNERTARDVIAVFLKNGIDGIVYENEYEGGVSYAAFTPSQIRSTNAAFDPDFAESANILKQSAPVAPIFFSQLKRAAEGLKQEKGTAQQFLSMIKKQPGVKSEELEWTGLEEYLNAKDKITKQEIVDFLDGNGVQVETVTKGGDLAQTKELSDWVSENATSPQTAQDWIDVSERLEGVAKQWQANGDNNQANRHFGLAEESNRVAEALETDSGAEIGAPKFANYQLPGGENYREVILTMPGQIEPYQPDDVHFTSEGGGTAIAWIRANDRTGPNGEKIFFVEEFQSLRQQHGRKQGFRRKKPITDTEVIDDAVHRDSIWDDPDLEEPTIEERKKIIDEGGSWVEDMLEQNRERMEQNELSKVPDAPFKGNAWAELAIKRVLRMAAEGGYDSVAWTTGEQQAERYDLSKQVESIDVTVEEDMRAIYILDKGNNDISLFVDNNGVVTDSKGADVTGKNLDEVVGKEIADKILKAESNVKLQEPDLKVGGEGMKGFYDKILPNLFKKVAGKLDKSARVGETAIESDGNKAVHSIPITDKMREGAMAGQALFQKDRGEIQFTDEGALIKLLSESDRTTFLHEFSHLALNMEAQFVGETLTTDQQAILDFLDAKSFDEITVKTGEKISDAKREKLEKWAKGFETYLYEGKAPSVELRSAFAKFREWMIQAYKDITRLGVKLNPDIRAVFDRMLATDEQIAAAHAELNYEILFDSAESAGKTPKEWADYQKQAQRAKDKPKATLEAKLLSQLKRYTEKWWKDELYAKRSEVRAEIEDLPVYQATRFIKAHTNSQKLDYASVKAILGTDIPPRLRKTTTENGLNPDEVAVQFGYRNGHEMLTDIIENETFTNTVNAEADARMKAQYGDILNDGSLEAEATAAAHNEERATLLMMELRQLTKGRPQIDRETLKQKAKDVISRTPIKSIRPAQYHRAEVKSAQKAAVEFKAGNKEAAAQAKEQQVANFYLWREATNAKERALKQRAYLAKVKTQKYSTRDVNVEYVRVMRLLASVYDFRKGAKPDTNKVLEVAKWIDEQINSEDAATLQYIDPNLSKAIFAIQEAKKTNTQPQITITNYDDMTAEELRGVYDQVKHLRYVGGKLSESEKAKFNAKVEKLGNSIYNNGKKVVTVPEEESSRDKAMQYLRQFSGDHLALADHIEEMDGFQDFGPMFNEFYQKIIDSSDVELKLKRETGDKLIEAFKPFTTNIKSSELRAKSWLREGAGTKNVKLSTGETWSLSARARIMLALYWGAPENHETIMKGRGVNEAEVNEMLSHLTDKELDLVEKIWEINESLWEPSKQVNMKLTGAAAPRVETKPYKIGDRELPGGYMRLYYDKEVKDMVLRDVDTLEKMTRAGSGVTKNTAHGSRHARVGSGGRRVSLDLNNVYRALDEVVHDTSFAETAIETTAILNSKPVRDAISTRYGMEKYKSVQQSLSNVIAGHVAGNGGFLNALMRVPRQAATYTILGYSIRNLLQQPLALGPMVSQVGEKQMAKAVMKFYSNPAKMVKFVQDNSEFMRNRTSLVNRDTAEAMNQLDSGVMSGAFKQHAFSLQTLGDAIVIYPGWLAAYDNGLKKFANHEKAATYASEVAAKSVGSGLMKDMSPLLQGKAESAKGLGPEAIKLYTFMYSYFNTMSRLVRKSAVKNDLGTVKGAGQFSREMFWIVAAPALIGAWMTGEGPDDDESWMMWAIKEMGFFGMGMVVGLRDMASAMRGFKPTTATGRAMSSAQRIYETTAKVAEGDADPFSPEVIARLVRAAGSITPVPGGSQLARTLDYYADDPDEPNIYSALVVGKKYD